MPPIDDPLARLQGRAVFEDVLQDFWKEKISLSPCIGQNLASTILVMDTRKFAAVKRLLHISEGFTTFSTAARQYYEKWISPCEDFLKQAVEAEHRRRTHWRPTYEWLSAHTERPSDSTSTEKFQTYSEAKRATLRARYAELNSPVPQGLSTDCPPTVRLDIRDHIIRMWYRDVKSRLDIYSALRDVPAKYHGLSCAIYTHLVVTGAINFGAVPLCTPVTTKFSRDKSRRRRRVAVIGAGFAGLTVARQLRSLGICVTVIEARDRIGGRVHSVPLEGFSCNVDLGAMLITGLTQNPLALLAEQTEAELHVVDHECALYDIDGSQVKKEIDTWAEREYNLTLDVTAVYRQELRTHSRLHKASLGGAFFRALAIREKMQQERNMENINDNPDQSPQPEKDLPPGQTNGSRMHSIPSLISSVESQSPNSQNQPGNETDVSSHDAECIVDGSEGSYSAAENRAAADVENAALAAAVFTGEANLPVPLVKERELAKRLLRWHISNLEYGCVAPLDSVSLLHWDQDDPYDFIGQHAMVKSGFKTLLDGLASGLERNIQLNTEVVAVEYSDTHFETSSVRLTMREKETIKADEFDAAVVTVPLGVLKSNSIKFSPNLPRQKRNAINRLGCGGLMKVILEFEHCFWTDRDMFGNLRENEETRGEFYMFWNLKPCCGKPILIGMVAEPAAKLLEQLEDDEVVHRSMNVLRRRYPHAPYPVAKAVSRWGNDKHSRGVYTNIPTNSSGLDYDLLARPVANSIFFAGEHTCRKYPTTCASAIISGLREASRLVDAFQLVDSINAVHARSLAVTLEQEIAKVSWVPKRSRAE